MSGTMYQHQYSTFLLFICVVFVASAHPQHQVYGRYIPSSVISYLPSDNCVCTHSESIHTTELAEASDAYLDLTPPIRDGLSLKAINGSIWMNTNGANSVVLILSHDGKELQETLLDLSTFTSEECVYCVQPLLFSFNFTLGNFQPNSLVLRQKWGSSMESYTSHADIIFTYEPKYYVLSVIPTQVSTKGGLGILVQGKLFFNSTNITCNFIFPSDTKKLNYIVTGTFLDNSTIQCTTPNISTAGTYFIEIDEDGLGYTENRIEIDFVDDAVHSSFSVIMGIVVLVILFSLTATAVGMYYYRKWKQERTDDAEDSFSLLPGMKGVTKFPRHQDL